LRQDDKKKIEAQSGEKEKKEGKSNILSYGRRMI